MVSTQIMMGTKHFNPELESILLAIIRDYELASLFEGWDQANGLPYPPYQLIDVLLEDGKLLIVVTDTVEDHDARIDGMRECYKLIKSLYAYLVKALYKKMADQALEFSYYEGDLLLVLVFTGPVPMVIEAIGRCVLPWIYQYYQHPKPEPIVMHDMAANVLNVSLGNPRDNEMRVGVIKRVLPMRLTYLQPLNPEVFPIEEPPPPVKSPSSTTSVNGANGTGYHEEETQPTEPPVPTNQRQNGHRKTAPLPGYFDEPAEM